MRRGTAVNTYRKGTDLCGSELARESVVPATANFECADAFASKLAPTGIYVEFKVGVAGRKKMKSQISDTKNPGLSTRVFAIDSESTNGCFRCFKAFSDP